MITIADIRAARERFQENIRLTPAPYSETLSREAGNVLYLKLENMNVTGMPSRSGGALKPAAAAKRRRASAGK